jgi:beta-phosphoglucomutase-like phosphatase (HAD superfamily)
MVKTIIFDLDGVLVYTDKFHYLAWKKMADRIGVPFDETINNRLRGVSRMDSLEIILERSTRKYTTEEKENLAEEKNGYYKEFFSSELENRRLTVSFYDNSPAAMTELICLALGLTSEQKEDTLVISAP